MTLLCSFMVSIKVPPLGESITEATLSRWLKNEGDVVAAGETIVELETDKITVEVPALKSGALGRRLHAEGDVVGVGDLLGELHDASAAPDVPRPAPAATPAAALPLAPLPPAPAEAPAGADVRSAPSARRLAEEAGVQLGGVPGTGRGGVVSRPDVVAAINASAAKVSDSTDVAK